MVNVQSVTLEKFMLPRMAEELAGMDAGLFPSVLSGTDYTYPIQVIDENLSLKKVLDVGWETGLFHERNWETLVSALEPYD